MMKRAVLRSLPLRKASASVVGLPFSSNSDIWLACVRAAMRIRTTAYKSSAQETMSKMEMFSIRKIFRAVGDCVAYNPTKRDKALAKEISHAVMMTIPGRLSVMDVWYLNG